MSCLFVARLGIRSKRTRIARLPLNLQKRQALKKAATFATHLRRHWPCGRTRRDDARRASNAPSRLCQLSACDSPVLSQPTLEALCICSSRSSDFARGCSRYHANGHPVSGKERHIQISIIGTHYVCKAARAGEARFIISTYQECITPNAKPAHPTMCATVHGSQWTSARAICPVQLPTTPDNPPATD
jgi:hypothetical protein